MCRGAGRRAVVRWWSSSRRARHKLVASVRTVRIPSDVLEYSSSSLCSWEAVEEDNPKQAAAMREDNDATPAGHPRPSPQDALVADFWPGVLGAEPPGLI